MYGYGLRSSYRGYGNVYLCVGAVGRYRCFGHRFMRGNLYMHGYFRSGKLYANADIHHYTTACNHCHTITNRCFM